MPENHLLSSNFLRISLTPIVLGSLLLGRPSGILWRVEWPHHGRIRSIKFHQIIRKNPPIDLSEILNNCSTTELQICS